MAWYKENSNVIKVTGEGEHWTTIYEPGNKVPYSGIYKCIGCKKEITSNRNDPLPPQNHHQHTAAEGSVKWKLIVRTDTEGKN